MALINHRAREIHFKIVYVGPGLGGKTTNLQQLHDRLPPERRGRLVSISTDHERTLFFDFLPIDLGHVNGFLTRFHLYTVPGQVYYRLSRRAVLQGLDGVVFVADSHPAREQANREALEDTHGQLTAIGVDEIQAARLPWVFQYNKRDVVSALPVARLHAALNPADAPEFESVAREGRGVSETLRAACKAVLSRLTSDLSAGVRPTAVAPTAAGAAVPAGAAQGASAPGGASPPGTTTAPERPAFAPPRIATAPRRIVPSTSRA